MISISKSCIFLYCLCKDFSKLHMTGPESKFDVRGDSLLAEWQSLSNADKCAPTQVMNTPLAGSGGVFTNLLKIWRSGRDSNPRPPA